MPEEEVSQQESTQEQSSPEPSSGQERQLKDLTREGERLNPDRLVAEYGDAKRALGALAAKTNTLEADLKKTRDDRRRLREQLPGDDERVLTPEEQKQLKEIGLFNDEGDFEPSRLRETLETAQNAQRELETLKRRESLRKVADVEGVENFDALARLADDEEFSVGERTVDGETEQFAQVTYTEDGQEKTVPLRDYEKLKPFHNSLFAQEEEEETPRRRMPTQGTTAKPREEQDRVETFIQEINEQNAARA